MDEKKKDPESKNGESTEELKNTKAEEASPSAFDAEKELLYLRAEFENYRKRVLRDQETAVRFANERFIREMLPILHLFDRALMASEPVKKQKESLTPEIKNFLLGIEMIQRELVLALERCGVELIGKKGEAFNPERHEAISHVETKSEPPGTVVDVLERGSLLTGRLLQPAKVTVSKETAA